MENKILFDFNEAMPDGRSVVMYRAFFDGKCAPVLTNVGDKQKCGPLFIGKANQQAFTNLAEPLAHYTRLAVAAKRTSEGDTGPLAEPNVVVPEGERAQIFIKEGSFDYVMETAIEFARSLEPKAEMVNVAQSFSREIDEREQRAQAQQRVKGGRLAGDIAPDSFVRVEPIPTDDLLARLSYLKNACPFRTMRIYLNDGRTIAIREALWLIVNLNLRFICIFEDGVKLLYFQEHEVRGVRVLNHLSWLLEEFPWYLRKLVGKPLDYVKVFLGSAFAVKPSAPPTAWPEQPPQSIEQRKVDILTRVNAVPFRPFVIRRRPDSTCHGITFSVIDPRCLCFTGETSIRVQDPVRPQPLEFQLESITGIYENIE
jgi:hypothetical protein